jgi:hypothetical protein
MILSNMIDASSLKGSLNRGTRVMAGLIANRERLSLVEVVKDAFLLVFLWQLGFVYDGSWGKVLISPDSIFAINHGRLYL